MKKPEDHIRMIKSPSDWPRWPLLPMKMSADVWDPIKGTRPVGVIIEMQGEYSKDGPITIFLSSMFQKITSDTPALKFPNAEAIIKAGWEVD